MTSILASRPPARLPATGDTFAAVLKAADCRILCFGYSNLETHIRTRTTGGPTQPRPRNSCVVFSGKLDDSVEGDDASEREESGSDSPIMNLDGDGKVYNVNSDLIREELEKIVGRDDSSFNGMDLATLIRNRYGRSYDVQLIKKNQEHIFVISRRVNFGSPIQEFMGRNLLALNVMWKYMEQRSFPLTEEEYILRLDDVANTLKCWGAVSHIRNSLQKVKERPRIGKVHYICMPLAKLGHVGYCFQIVTLKACLMLVNISGDGVGGEHISKSD
ncbi:hypothetical protein SASPL_140613 [Salvia splendens]|uniref:Uncharacterized protein n=1 Tax=Salvia splendens TaxID=180675 RepID=A0A8X8WS04_SALSN|nr:hypothetical protein SASPL_140613 [Salvia splendens]